MSYTVLARRYRSREFDEVIGQEPIARTLKNAIANQRTAHAYLFCGTRGVGKTSMARIFAKAINATDDLAQKTEIDEAIRLSPRDPFLAYWFIGHAVAAFIDKRYKEAIEWCKKSIEENPSFPGAFRVLASCYGSLGQIEDAKAALGKLLNLAPGITVSATRQQVPWKNPEDSQRYLDGLRKAGMPED